MNILTSYNWLKEYLDTDLSPEEFAKKTTNSGNSVEYMHVLRDVYANMVVGEVVELKPHPNADKLQIAMTNIGKKTVQIVCGGENLAEGQLVVVGLLGAKVKWHGEGDFVELTETKIRGEKSYGMICSASEIGFEKYPEGPKDIMDISLLTDSKPGTLIVDALDLDDVIFDIEVTTNRPDCKSIIGQAREGSAVTGADFTWSPTTLLESDNLSDLTIEVKDSDRCPKYQAIRIDGVRIGPSPWWLQKKILLSGHRPINNLVDVTNYILHEYGQPMHTFDAAKLDGDQLVVRRAKSGEKIVALDENEYELTDEMLVIADSKKPVAIAGVIGGVESGTTEETTSIVLECATFEPVSTRRAARALNIQTDSSQLFEKGLSVEATEPALARAIELVLELAGGEIGSNVFTFEKAPYEVLEFDFEPLRVKKLMATELTDHDMLDILKRLGFESSIKKGKSYRMKVPYWRDNDIENSVDFVEEIARVYGYDKIPSMLPVGEIAPAQKDPVIYWQRKLKKTLRGNGLIETYGYSFVSEQELQNYDIDPADAVKLLNPLSSDHSHMRPSLVPSVLSTIAANEKQIDQAALFEIAPVYEPQQDDIPIQRMHLIVGVYDKDGKEAFAKAKGILLNIAEEMGIRTLRFERTVQDPRWHSGRSVAIWIGEHEHVGIIGQVSHGVQENFGIDAQVVLIEMNFDVLIGHASEAKQYHPIPQFPAVKRDLAIVVDDRIEYESVWQKMKSVSGLLHEVELFDVYRGKGVDEGKKSLAMHLTFRALDRTLEAEEVDTEMDGIRKMLEKEFNAIMRS